jgi:hypothetical protein
MIDMGVGNEDQPQITFIDGHYSFVDDALITRRTSIDQDQTISSFDQIGIAHPRFDFVDTTCF